MSSALELWAEYQALKADGASLHTRGRVYREWFTQAIREGDDPTRISNGHLPVAEQRPWRQCGCVQCQNRRAA